MSLTRLVTGLSMLGLFSLTCLTAADPPGKADPAANDQQVVKSAANQKAAASTVNFRQQLNLPFATLNNLGTRIDAARRSHDPVALGNAAMELSVAEKVSGKKAAITSPQLAKEAAELAKLRRQDKEMQAVLKMQEQLQGEADDIATLNNTIQMTKQQIAADQASVNTNLEPTWAPRTVVVNNYTSQYLDISVNGNYKVQVAPGMQQTFMIEHRWNPTVLTAYGDSDSINWGPRYIWGKFSKYTWNIN
jgi:hypothetical protein